jgi:putative ABC transport system permease protein
METLLGVPLDVIMVGSLGTTLLVVGLLLLSAIRRPLLLRLALRNPGRRPLQAGLITLGLTLSTVVVGTAFNTGDTITHTVRSLVASGLGRADEVVLALPRDQRRSPAEYVGALLNGSLLTGLGGYLPEQRAGTLIAAVSRDDRIAGMTPAIGGQVTVVNLDQQAVQGQVSVLALPPDYPPVFGALVSPDGEPISLADLAADELLATADAAAQVGAEAGTRLELRAGDVAFPTRVRAVVSGGELGGTQPTLFVPLARYQRLLGRDGTINQILVANRGDASASVRLSGEVTRSLRVALADRGAAAALFDLFHTETAQNELASAARTAEGRQRQKLEGLLGTLRQPALSDEFIGLATDPDLERRLLPLGARLAFASGAGFSGFPDISPLRVLEVKQASQDQADRWGGALTSVFLILGLFSLATGALLVFLIFLTLAAERRSELGITRALGGRRRDVVLMFLLEGAAYDVPASALGLVLGVLLAVAITALGDAALSGYGLHLQPHFEPRSLVVAYCLGLLLTFLSVGYSAWHISRLSVVRAIRNLPDPPREGGRRWITLAGPALLTLGPALCWLGSEYNLALPQAVGVALVLVGLALGGRALLGRVGASPSLGDRLAYSCCGGGLLVYWLLPSESPLLANLRPAPRSIDLFFLAGLSIVLGAVWVAVYNLGVVTGPLLAATVRLHSLGLALRTAAANPLHHRFRTGMIVAMFALVIFNMVVAGVLLTATHRAYSDPEALAGGFDVRAELTRPADVPDLAAALESAPAIRPEDFTEIGRLATRPGQVIELGTGARRWRSYTLQEVDPGFIDGLRSPLAARADGFASDAEVWDAVKNRPGFAVVGGPAVGSRQVDPSLSSGFRFADLYQDDVRFAPRELWARDERGGQALMLTVIGVLDSRVSFGAGLYTSGATLNLAGARPPQRAAYYLKARPGGDPSALALGLNLALGDRGLRATATGEEVRRIQSVRALLNELLQGFFGVGLLAGLAALGVISMRAVVERRQQIGLLRALGFRRQMVRLSLLLETSLVALLGIGLGVGLGLALSRRLVDYLGRQYPEIVFGVPWDEIGLIALGAYVAALLLAALPLWQIGRIQPAEALRCE